MQCKYLFKADDQRRRVGEPEGELLGKKICSYCCLNDKQWHQGLTGIVGNDLLPQIDM